MTKEFYQILQINETATAEEIKKVYRKLAVKWHPDKQNDKSLEERKQANDMMQKINKAYEILGNEDKKRSYDLGLTDFSDDDFGFQYDPKEEVKKQEAELRRREVNIADLELEILKLEMKALDRSSTLNEIGSVFCFTLPRVHAEDLDPILWQPYQSWGEKVVKMEITIPKGKDRSKELKKFKEEMDKAIKEAEINLRVREESKKKNEDDSEINQARTVAFQEIEKSMNEKSLKVKELGQYSNYQEKINSLGEVERIRSFREEVLGFISKLARKEKEFKVRERDNYHSLNNPYPPRGQLEYWNNNNPNFLSYNSQTRENPNYYSSRSNFNPGFSGRPDSLRTEPRRVLDRQNEPWGRIEGDKKDNFLGGNRKYGNWTKEELIDELEREKSNNSNNLCLQKEISDLKTKNKKLEERVQVLESKTTAPQTSLFGQMPSFFNKEKKMESKIELPPKKIKK